MISASGRESGLDLSKQKVNPKIIFGWHHGALSNSFFTAADFPKLRCAQINTEINLHSWVHSSCWQGKSTQEASA